MARSNKIAFTGLALSLILVAYSGPVLAKPAAGLQLTELKRTNSKSGWEFISANFTTNPDEMLIVEKGYEPDGHEAEEYSEAELKSYQKRAEKESRWADPSIKIITLTTGKRENIDYGWNPITNKERSVVYYAHQEKPITGKRVLADSQQGNQIMVWNRATKEKKVLAKPTKGYYDEPMLNADGSVLVYSKNDATNGAWGGQVGVGILDLRNNKELSGIEPQKHHELYDLIGPTWLSGNAVNAVIRTPKAGGTYLADEYANATVSIDPLTGKLSPSKSKPPKDAIEIAVEETAAKFTRSDSRKVTKLTAHGSNIFRNASLSPDAKRCVLTVSVYNKKGRFDHDELRFYAITKR